jgi:hypothetical protein
MSRNVASTPGNLEDPKNQQSDYALMENGYCMRMNRKRLFHPFDIIPFTSGLP